jgi:glucose/arabinose dehydrogenase
MRIAVRPVLAFLLLTGAAGCGGSGAAATSPSAPPGAVSRYDLAAPQEVARGLDVPWGLAFLPGGDALISERDTGRVLRLTPGGEPREIRVVEGVNADGEGGLLGLAVSPDGLVYAYLTAAEDNRIVRFGLSGGEQELVLGGIAKSSFHNGGRIAFGPDGMLYAIVGDAHDSSNAQDTTNEDRGKIIRIEPDGDAPTDNPFGDRVWAFGIRNSFGFAFDPRTGDLWETENGPSCNDEINRIRRGENYGWGPSETCDDAAPGNTNQDGPNPILPELLFGAAIGITGVAFCDGCRLGPQSDGAAFFGAVNNGEVTRIVFNDQRTAIAGHTVVFDHGGSTLSYEVGPGGRIYFSDFHGIHKLVNR